MEKKYIKRFAMILTVIVTLGLFGNLALGTEHSTKDDIVTSGEMVELAPIVEVEKNQNTEDNMEALENADIPSASKDVIGNVSENDRKKAELIDEYNDELLGMVAYGLFLIQKYSLPICFIGITMGAFNFLILGNKKLDKKEQGFGWIVGFTMALVVFNVLPLIYAVLVVH